MRSIQSEYKLNLLFKSLNGALSRTTTTTHLIAIDGRHDQGVGAEVRPHDKQVLDHLAQDIPPVE